MTLASLRSQFTSAGAPTLDEALGTRAVSDKKNVYALTFVENEGFANRPSPSVSTP